MTKLYYDCPLEAAYMAKNFGVKYKMELVKDGTDIPITDIQEMKLSLKTINKKNILGFALWLEQNDVSAKFIIEADSLHIFEPQEGDRNIGGYVFTQGQWVVDGMIPAAMLAGIPREIHKRNGKAFIWPREEE